MYDLAGVNGNAYSVMSYVARAMRESKKSKAEIAAYYKDAMSGDYNHLLAVSVAMIDSLNELRGYSWEDDE
jgi:uncharacterized protein (UPF0264 family)